VFWFSAYDSVALILGREDDRFHLPTWNLQVNIKGISRFPPGCHNNFIYFRTFPSSRHGCCKRSFFSDHSRLDQPEGKRKNINDRDSRTQRITPSWVRRTNNQPADDRPKCRYKYNTTMANRRIFYISI